MMEIDSNKRVTERVYLKGYLLCLIIKLSIVFLIPVFYFIIPYYYAKLKMNDLSFMELSFMLSIVYAILSIAFYFFTHFGSFLGGLLRVILILIVILCYFFRDNIIIPLGIMCIIIFITDVIPLIKCISYSIKWKYLSWHPLKDFSLISFGLIMICLILIVTAWVWFFIKAPVHRPEGGDRWVTSAEDITDKDFIDDLSSEGNKIARLKFQTYELMHSKYDITFDSISTEGYVFSYIKDENTLKGYKTNNKKMINYIYILYEAEIEENGDHETVYFSVGFPCIIKLENGKCERYSKLCSTIPYKKKVLETDDLWLPFDNKIYNGEVQQGKNGFNIIGFYNETDLIDYLMNIDSDIYTSSYVALK